ARSPERALNRLQFLLLDEDTCLARVAWLRTLAAAAGRQPSTRAVRPAPEAFPEEIALLCAEGLFAAHAAGRLTAERVQRLDWLTHDPDALWRTHQALAADVPGPVGAAEETAAGTAPGTTPVTEPTAGGFTSLAAAGRWPELGERLRPYVPAML